MRPTMMLIASLVLVPVLAAGCQPKPPPTPVANPVECCIRSYQATPDESNVHAGTVTVRVTVDQYRWFGQPNDPQGGVFRAETRDAPAEGVSFEVGFAPDKPGSGLQPVTAYMEAGDKGRLAIKMPAEVLEYARHGSGTRISLRPDLRTTDPWIQTEPTVALPEGPFAVDFQTLSDMLLNSGR